MLLVRHRLLLLLLKVRLLLIESKCFKDEIFLSKCFKGEYVAFKDENPTDGNGPKDENDVKRRQKGMK